jgi:hypothetical protein
LNLPALLFSFQGRLPVQTPGRTELGAGTFYSGQEKRDRCNVWAWRGKTVRAEPVSALYGYERDGSWHKDQVRHAGEFRELEDQMLNFSTAGYLGDRSPDRVDALVWALTDLLVEPMPLSRSCRALRLVLPSLRLNFALYRHRFCAFIR